MICCLRTCSNLGVGERGLFEDFGGKLEDTGRIVSYCLDRDAGNPMAMRPQMQELISAPPQSVEVQIPKGKWVIGSTHP
jgi:hypothetical protein